MSKELELKEIKPVKYIKIIPKTKASRGAKANIPESVYGDMVDNGIIPGETKMTIESTNTGFRVDKVEE